MAFLFGCRTGVAAEVESSGVLTLQSSQYVSGGQTYFRDDAESTNTSIGVMVDLQRRWRGFGGHVLLKDEYSASENWNYLNIYELKASYSLTANTTAYLGRHLDEYTAWEERWRQGLFQPRYLQNKLRPEFAGLTGAFVDFKSGRGRFSLGLLPVHLPEFGAHFYVRDDKFASENPWFVPPASQFVFRQETSDIRYSVSEPDKMDVVSNPGVVTKYEWKSSRYTGRFSGAYKPMPQLLLGFPSENRVVIGSEDYMALEIHARVLYHQLYAMDHAFKFGPWNFEASLTHERPGRDEVRADWTSQQVQPAWVTALGVSRALETEGPLAARAHLHYLNVDGGDARDEGVFANDATLFERRYQYVRAFRFALSKPWRGWFRYPLYTEASAVYDSKQNGGVFSFTSALNVTRNFKVSFEADFLGLVDTDAEVEKGFLSLYRANDRVGLGMSYVF